jgi:hypothetical protein
VVARAGPGMARSHHCEKGSKDAPESQEVKLSGLTQPLPALSLAPKRGASLSSSHVLSASANSQHPRIRMRGVTR